MTKQYILPLKGLVIQPGITAPIFIDNPASIAVIERAAAETKQIVLVPQHSGNYPIRSEDLYDVGTLADVLQVLTLPDGTLHCMTRTLAPVRLSGTTLSDGSFSASAEVLPQRKEIDETTAALRDKICEGIRFIGRVHRANTDKLKNIAEKYPIAAFVESVMNILDLDTDDSLKVLVMETWNEKLTEIMGHVSLMSEMARLDDKIDKRVNSQMNQLQREMYLQEKMRALQKEMGGDPDDAEDTASYKKRIEKSQMPRAARERALSELKRIRGDRNTAESAMLKTYLDELLSMPWASADKSEIDLTAARETLNSEHFGMDNVKDLILEHLAVMKKTGNFGGTILCLVGSPGVGKTSLGQSVARALGRKYQRISLGGISDEAHFRGHRKTYIGSQPGRIMDALKRAGTNNPVIILDEIDKMGRDWRGDPESALLEILDPEQNKSFRDHYLECDFDLSNVVFIATANSLNFSPALKDRMDIIEIAPYGEDEKMEIARRHLIGRAAADTGWAVDNINFPDGALRHLIQNYTHEDGVRELRRKISALLRRELLNNNGEDVPTVFDKDKIDLILSLRMSPLLNRKIGFGLRA
ncbi:MAG: AAA family ATPase [Rickettsiales bacterium]|jgi:ATP-dependent Lon protease|nr:AAA family ATPase [Rickettsiales bacterium]